MQVVVIVSSGHGSGRNGRCHVMLVGEAAAMFLLAVSPLKFGSLRH